MEEGYVSDSRVKKSVNNIFIGVVNRVLLLVLNFVLRTVMIKTLGVEYLGINSTFADIMAMICMADLGFNTAVVYSFYEPLAKNDKKMIQALTTFYKKIYNTIAIVIALIGVCVFPFLNKIVNLEQNVPYLNLYYFLALAEAIGSYLFTYKISVMVADQREYLQVRINMVCNTIKIILQIALLICTKNYTIYLVLSLITTLTSNVISSIKAENEYPYIKEKRELDKEKKQEIFKNIRAVFLYKISNVVLSGTDNTLISMLIGTIYVGYYSNYFLLENSLYVIMKIIFSSTTASVGNLVVTEDTKTRYQIFNYMQTVGYCMCAIIIPCYFVLVDDFVFKVWLGEQFGIGMFALIGICFNFYMMSVFLPVVSFREAVGLYKETKYVMLMAAVLNIVLSVILSMKFGMAGILIATPIARILTYGWYEPQILYRKYFERSAIVFLTETLKNVIYVIAISGICYYIGHFVHVNGIFSWIEKGIVCITVSLICTVLIYGRTEGFKWLLEKIMKIFGQK